MARPIVVDASAMVDFLVDDLLVDALEARFEHDPLHAPAHFDAEVLGALAGLLRRGHVAARTARAAAVLLRAAPVTRHPLPPLVEGAWRRRANLSVGDAFYVELAEQLGAPLVTTDARLAAAYRGAELVGA